MKALLCLYDENSTVKSKIKGQGGRMTPKTRLSQMILQGRYQPGTSLLHRMVPSLKLVLVLILFLLASWGHLEVLAGLMLVCLLAMALAHVPFKTVGTLLYAFRWLFLIIGLFPLFTTPGAGIEELEFLPFTVSWEGCRAGLEAFLKLLEMFFLSMILVRTTSPQALMNTLQKAVIIPHPTWKKKIQEFFMTGLWAVQLIPMICVEAESFILSRLNEEDEKKVSGLKKAWRAASQLGPLMSHLFQQMDEWEPELTGNQRWGDWQPEVN
ncbi:MAG: energy-coupling factor transporter transmembrane protein EcfT [Nitrospinota bacterium]|nr:energy-coupling factor transporter transmembrane protein EcfT [Nitrospinota bacterium]